MSCRRCWPTQLLFIGLLVVACDDREPPGPLPNRIEPRQGSNEQRTEVAIWGTGFIPLLRANYGKQSEAVVSTAFAVRLGDAPLEQVTYVDNSRLRAVVPAGLRPGTYDLTVSDPRGREGTLSAAFTVQGLVDGGADGSALDARQPDSGGGVHVTSVAGTGTAGFFDGPGAGAQFNNPMALALRGSTLFVSDYSNHRIRSIALSATSTVATVAGSGTQGYVDDSALAARFAYPEGLAVDGAGTLYVGDTGNDRIRQLKDGNVSTLAGDGTRGFNNGAAASARFNLPSGLAVAAGTVYVADKGNHRIRAIAGGVVSTLAGSGAQGFADGSWSLAQFDSPTGLALGGGQLYVADSGNHRIRVINISTHATSTLAGTGVQGNTDGAAIQAQFSSPVALALFDGKLYVADSGNHRIRVIDLASQQVSTLAGVGSTAVFQYPQGLAIAAAGQLFVADKSHHRVQMVSF